MSSRRRNHLLRRGCDTAPFLAASLASRILKDRSKPWQGTARANSTCFKAESTGTGMR